MATNLTITSRLRVLIAKAFRAEQLYSSMRHARPTRPDLLTELAHDTRSAVWQRAYAQLRTTLNDIVASATPGNIAQRVIELRQQCESRVREASMVVDRINERLIESAERHEFAHVMKLALELVEFKAHTQAQQVISDELSEILQSVGRNVATAEVSEGAASAQQQDEELLRAFREAAKSNVIPLRPRVASGTRR